MAPGLTRTGTAGPARPAFSAAVSDSEIGREVWLSIVTGIRVGRGAVHGVDTDQGSIEAEAVVNAGGIYAPEIGAMVGLTLPIIPMAHQYLLARIKEEIPEDLPTMRDPDLLVYFRRDASGLVMGGYERDPAPWGLDGIARDSSTTIRATCSLYSGVNDRRCFDIDNLSSKKEP